MLDNRASVYDTVENCFFNRFTQYNASYEGRAKGVAGTKSKYDVRFQAWVKIDHFFGSNIHALCAIGYDGDRNAFAKKCIKIITQGMLLIGKKLSK